MMSRSLAWIACSLLGASLVGCRFEEFDQSKKDTDKKLDELTRKVDALHDLLAKRKQTQPKAEDQPRQEKRTTAEVSDLFGAVCSNRDQTGVEDLTIPYSLEDVAGKKLVLDFTRTAAVPSADARDPQCFPSPFFIRDVWPYRPLPESQPYFGGPPPPGVTWNF